MRPSALYTARQKEQDRKFSCILYPDSTTYNIEICLNNVRCRWTQYYYILHDCDRYTNSDVINWIDENSVIGEPEPVCPFSVGDLKKPHYHVVVYCDSPRLLGNATKSLGLICSQGEDDQSNFVERVVNFKQSVRYLTHIDHPDKFQYKRSEIHFDKSYPPDKYFSGADFVGDCKLISNFLSKWNIYENGLLSYNFLMSWILDNGVLTSYIRNQVLFNKIVDDLQKRYYIYLESMKRKEDNAFQS